MQMELRHYVINQEKTNTFYWVRYAGDRNFTTCDQKAFFNTCRWDDGGRGKIIRSPRKITLLLDSLEAKTDQDHEITLTAVDNILKAIPELQPYAISILSLGPTQKLLENDRRNGNILSGTIFDIKRRLLKGYKNRLKGYKIIPQQR